MSLQNLTFLVLSVLMLTACGGAGEQPAVKAVERLTPEDAPDDGKVDPMADFKFHRMMANLPSPLETFQLLSSTNADLAPVELTPTDLASKLTTMSQKAFGYGIYVTDMGFLAYEQSNQEVLNYMKTCRQLAQALGAGEVFDRSIAKKYKQHETSQEQFVNMMAEGFKAIDDYMQTNERFLNATEIFVGSWVESQIIATRMLKGKAMNERNESIYKGIYTQKMHASNLMNVLGEVDTEIAPDVYAAVEDLMMFYAGFGAPESISQEDLKELEKKLVTLKQRMIG